MAPKAKQAPSLHTPEEIHNGKVESWDPPMRCSTTNLLIFRRDSHDSHVHLDEGSKGEAWHNRRTVFCQCPIFSRHSVTKVEPLNFALHRVNLSVDSPSHYCTRPDIISHVGQSRIMYCTRKRNDPFLLSSLQTIIHRSCSISLQLPPFPSRDTSFFKSPAAYPLPTPAPRGAILRQFRTTVPTNHHPCPTRPSFAHTHLYSPPSPFLFLSKPRVLTSSSWEVGGFSIEHINDGLHVPSE